MEQKAIFFGTAACFCLVVSLFFGGFISCLECENICNNYNLVK